MRALVALLVITHLAHAACPQQPWAWLKGSNADLKPLPSPTEIRAVGAESVLFQPQESNSAAAWVDEATGDLWLFGGISTNAAARADTLWRWRNTTKLWAWMGDGTLPQTWPPNLAMPGTWFAGGSLYLFGGVTDAVAGTDFPANSYSSTRGALWRYTIEAGAWTLVADYGSNDNVVVSTGTYAAGNKPGARSQQRCAKDSSGVVWMTHGFFVGEYSDVWSVRNYDATTPEWAYWGDAGPQTSNPPATPTHPGGRDSQALWIDASDRLWLYGGNEISQIDLGDMYYIDLPALVPGANATWTRLVQCTPVVPALNCPATPTYPGSRSFAGAWTDAAGTLLYMLGGRINVGFLGLLQDLWQFNTSSLRWTQLDGPLPSALNFYNGTSNFSTPRTSGALSYDNMPGARRSPAVAASASVVYLYGGFGYADTATRTHLPDLWTVTPVCAACPYPFYGDDCTCLTPPVPGFRCQNGSYVPITTTPPPTTSPPPTTAPPTTAPPTTPPPTTAAPTTTAPPTTPPPQTPSPAPTGLNTSGGVLPVGNATVVVPGPLVVLPGTVIAIAPGGSIVVGECATLSANVTIEVALPAPPPDGQAIAVLASNCTSGPTPSVVLRRAYKESCRRRTKGSVEQDAAQGLTVLLSVSNECAAVSTAAIVGIAVGAVALLVILALILVALLVKRGVISLRTRRRRPNYNTSELYAN